MKRLAVGVVGFCYGLFITWICLVALSHIDWLRAPQPVAHGCNELGQCPLAWYNWPMLYVFIFGPATLGATLNAYAWRRWSVKRWSYHALSLTGVIVALYFFSGMFTQ